MSDLKIKTSDSKLMEVSVNKVANWVSWNESGNPANDDHINFVKANISYFENNMTAKFHSGTFLGFGINSWDDLFDKFDEFTISIKAR